MAKRALRNGGVQFLTRARNGIASGFMYRPPWFDAAVQFQPLEVARSYGPVRPLEYPEDKLMARLEREHPELWEVRAVWICAPFVVSALTWPGGPAEHHCGRAPR